MKLCLKRWLRLMLTPHFVDTVDGDFGRWFIPIRPATGVFLQYLWLIEWIYFLVLLRRLALDLRKSFGGLL